MTTTPITTCVLGSPVRRCVSLNRIFPSALMIRFVQSFDEASGEIHVVPDIIANDRESSRVLLGKGCYVYSDSKCIEFAIKKGKFLRAFPTSGRPPSMSHCGSLRVAKNLVDIVREELNRAFGKSLRDAIAKGHLHVFDGSSGETDVSDWKKENGNNIYLSLVAAEFLRGDSRAALLERLSFLDDVPPRVSCGASHLTEAAGHRDNTAVRSENQSNPIGLVTDREIAGSIYASCLRMEGFDAGLVVDET